jgi:hypothetical protein
VYFSFPSLNIQVQQISDFIRNMKRFSKEQTMIHVVRQEGRFVTVGWKRAAGDGIT